MRKIKFIVSSCVVLMVIGLFSVVRSQTTTSNIEGTVTDPNGAVVAGATVKATGANSAAERTAVTDSGFLPSCCSSGRYL
ncbi:MAG: carboxypeptidase regulatory-like domain-containing protein [Chloracidobacterium sp.]|nr:carboxypeptidase regulatory-like domain-containing protein [Chloracidobacterium sp.]